MLPPILIRIAWSVGLAFGVSSLFAQTPGLPQIPGYERLDEQPRSNQRILPLPAGQPSVLQQIELLERLNRLAGDQRPSSPELSESQLKMLDRVVNSFRNDAGELEMPNLDLLPPGLIDNLLTDPVQRQQARRLLEQYARQRNLDIGGTNSSLPELPRERSTSRTAQDKSSSAGSQPKNPFESASVPGSPPSKSNGIPDVRPGDKPNVERPENSPSRRDPDRRDPERRAATPKRDELQAIEELVKNLRMIDEAQQKASANKSPATKKPQTGATAGRSSAPRSAQPRNSRSPSTQAQSTQRSNRLPPPNEGRGGAQRYPGMSPIPNTFPPMPEFGDETDSSLAERERATSESNESTAPGSSLNERSFKLELDEADRLDPFREARSSPTDLDSSDNPFAAPQSASENAKSTRGFRVKELAERLQPSNSIRGAGRPNGQASTAANAKPSNNSNSSGGANNLVQSLRGLVNKALKEQGHDERSATELLRETTRGLVPGAGRPDAGPSDNSALASQPGSSSTGTPNGKSSADNYLGLNNKATSTTSAPNVPGAWRSLVQDVWRSISTPPTIASGAIPPAKTLGGGSALGLPDFTNSRVLAVLAAAAVALLALYWLARRGRSTSATNSSDAHDRWVREVLTYGLKTRADVVRAFHLFVAQNSQPIASWWHHRHVARQLAAASPQIGPALDELAGVYEQARYTPPEIPLQAEQLERMRLALEKCRRV